MKKRTQTIISRGIHPSPDAGISPSEGCGKSYTPACVSSVSCETEGSILTTSFIVTIEGQELGTIYDFSDIAEDGGSTFNNDWDGGTL